MNSAIGYSEGAEVPEDKTEIMNGETRERIEKEAQEYLNNLDEVLSDDEVYFARLAYIAGATVEHSRITELLKKERNKVIDECIDRIQKYFDKADLDAPKLLIEMVESLKGKLQ